MNNKRLYMTLAVISFYCMMKVRGGGQEKFTVWSMSSVKKKTIQKKQWNTGSLLLDESWRCDHMLCLYFSLSLLNRSDKTNLLCYFDHNPKRAYNPDSPFTITYRQVIGCPLCSYTTVCSHYNTYLTQHEQMCAINDNKKRFKSMN